jgi:hypothetical protein
MCLVVARLRWSSGPEGPDRPGENGNGRGQAEGAARQELDERQQLGAVVVEGPNGLDRRRGIDHGKISVVQSPPWRRIS